MTSTIDTVDKNSVKIETDCDNGFCNTVRLNNFQCQSHFFAEDICVYLTMVLSFVVIGVDVVSSLT